MNSSAHGNTTSAVEVTQITRHGVWLLAHGKELFIPYDEFPWFREQPRKAVMNVEEPAPGHFRWPDIDVDLTAEIIEHPERFPERARPG